MIFCEVLLSVLDDESLKREDTPPRG